MYQTASLDMYFITVLHHHNTSEFARMNEAFIVVPCRELWQAFMGRQHKSM